MAVSTEVERSFGQFTPQHGTFRATILPTRRSNCAEDVDETFLRRRFL